MKNYIIAALFLAVFFIGCASTSDSAGDSSAAAGPEITLIDDFESNESTTLRFTYDDKPDGGTSVVIPASIPEDVKDKQVAMEMADGMGAEESNGWFKMTGNITTAFSYGYSGLGIKFDKDSNPVDINGYTGLMFWAKGDGRRYRLQFVTDNITDYCYFNFPFTAGDEWKLVKVPFKFVIQETWGQAKGKKESFSQVSALQFQTIGQPLDSYELNIDNIMFYKD